jgi:DNA-binding NtrC family response regulator
MRQRESDFPRSVPEEETGYQDRDRKILSISAAPEDHKALRDILCDPEWRITCAFSCQQAIAYLCRDRVGVIVCDCHLPDGTWRDLLSHIAALTEPAAVIVTSGTADACLRAEVHALGGYEVLTKPFQPGEVARVIVAAWQNIAVAAPEPAPA